MPEHPLAFVPRRHEFMQLRSCRNLPFAFETIHEQPFPLPCCCGIGNPVPYNAIQLMNCKLWLVGFPNISSPIHVAFAIVPDIPERPVPIDVRIPVGQLSKFTQQSHYVISVYQYRVAMNIDMANAFFCIIRLFVVYHIKTGKRIKA